MIKIYNLLFAGFWLLISTQTTDAQTCIECTTSIPLNNGLVFCAPMNGNANDVTITPLTATITGATLTPNRFSNINNAYDFSNIASSRIKYNTSSKLSVPANQSITMSAWFYVRSTHSFASEFFRIVDANNSSFEIFIGGTNHGAGLNKKLAILNFDGPSASSVLQVQTTSDITLNTWHHVVVTVNKSINKTSLYLDGVLAASGVGVNNTLTNSFVCIGNHEVNAWGLNGKVDDARIYNRVLDSVEILTLFNSTAPRVLSADTTVIAGSPVPLMATGGTTYSWNPTTGLNNPNIANPVASPTSTTQYIATITNGTCTKYDTVNINIASATSSCIECTTSIPLNSGLIFCAPMAGTATDVTSSPVTPTISGATSLSQDRFNNNLNAYNFSDISTAKISYNASSKLSASANQSLTMSIWFYARSTHSWGSVLGTLISNNASAFTLLVGGSIHGAFNKKILFNDFYGPNSSTVVTLGSSADVSLNAWHHVAVTIDRSTNRVKLYYDGQMIKDSISTSSVITNGALYIGNNSVNAWGIDGKVDDVRIYSRNLSSNEITQLYNTSTIAHTAIADKTILLGDSIQLVATGGTTYSWSPAVELNNPNIANPYAKPSTSRQYIVTITDSTCTYYDTVNINIVIPTSSCIECTTSIPLNSGLVFCAPMTGNANDVTSTPVTPAISGATALSPDRFNNNLNAYNFSDISTAKISYNASSKLSASANQSLTMSTWFYARSTHSWGSVIGALIGTDGSAFTLLVGGSIHGSFNKKILFNDFYGPNSSTVVTLGSSADVSLNAWHHVAVTIDRSTNRVKLYYDGQMIQDSISTSSVITNGALYLGNSSMNAWGIDGKVDDVRIYNRSLSSNEITQLYNASTIIHTPIADKTILLGDSVQLVATGGTTYSWSPATGLNNPNIANPFAKPSTSQQYIVTITDGNCSKTDTIMVNVKATECFSCNDSAHSSINAGLVACYPFNGNTNDESGNGNNGTAQANVTLTTDRNNWSSKAYAFNATSTSRINIPASASLNTASMSSFTYACWFNASASSLARRIVCIQDASFKNYDLSYNYNTNKLNFINFNGTSSNIDFNSKTTFTLNTWHHIAFVIDSANKVSLYVDGELDTFSTITVLKPLNPTYTIGNHTVNAWNFMGKIDDVRVYNRALTANELFILFSDDKVVITNQDTVILRGDSVQVRTKGGANFYHWSPAIGVSDTTIANPTLKPLTTTQYILTSGNGTCEFSDTITITVDSLTSGLKSENKRLHLTLSPNPSSNGIFNYSFTQHNVPNALQVTLFNQLGQLIAAEKYTTGKSHIDISTLNHGLYFVAFTHPDTGEKTIVKIAYW